MLQELYVAPTQAEALDVVRRSLGLKYRAYQQWGQDSILPDDQSFDREFDELRQGRFILGDPAECIRRIQSLVETVGPTHLLLRMQWPGMTQHEVMSNMQLFATEVMPAL